MRGKKGIRVKVSPRKSEEGTLNPRVGRSGRRHREKKRNSFPESEKTRVNDGKRKRR